MDFILVPDSLSAVRVRQNLAQKNGINIRVGTFSALLDVLQELWLLPEVEDNFDELLRQHSLSSQNSFWSKSIQVDESSVLIQLRQSLNFMLDSLPLDEKLKKISGKSREINYFNQLLSLYEAMDCVRPYHQVIAQNWLSQSHLPAIEDLQVYYLPECFSLSIWQKQILEPLSCEALNSSVQDNELVQVLKQSFEPATTRKKDLNYLRATLFNPALKTIQNNLRNIKFIRLRDSLQEIETVVSSIQYAIGEGAEVQDITIVVPNDSDYLDQVLSLLNYAGILSSNKQSIIPSYTWHQQLIKDLMDCFVFKNTDQNLIPTMLTASVLNNPCMPWSIRKGQQLAQNCIDNQTDYNLENLDKKYHPLYEVLTNINHDDCFEWLTEIIPHLKWKGNHIGTSQNQLLEWIAEFQEQCSIYSVDDPIEALKKVSRQIIPGSVDTLSQSNTTILNGVTVLTESEWLNQPVKHLYILGFNQGHYIADKLKTGVFRNSVSREKGSLAQQLGGIDKQLDKQILFENHFMQLISCATDSLTFFLSEQSIDGEKLLLSETMFDLSLILQADGNINPELMVLSIDDGQSSFNYKVSKSVPVILKNKPEIIPDSFSFDMNLLNLHKDEDGKQHPESPSSLEKMMVSPFAWLLSRQGFTAKGWQVQTIDIMLKGTIAHKVFEMHFDKKVKQLPYDDCFQQAVEIEAPYLLHQDWKMEFIQLKAEIEKALLPFIDWCTTNKWKVIETEKHLVGKIWSINIHGFADVILKKGQHYLVLDYKKSKSDSRKKRLDASYDLQTTIYCSLFSTMSDSKAGQKSNSVSSGYYTLNDQTLLLDFKPGHSVQDIDSILIDNTNNAQSREATTLIKEQIKNLKKGVVTLNSEDDIAQWDKSGVTAKYTLDDAPIVQYFYTVGESQNG